VPAGGRFSTHVHDTDTLVLDDGGPINPGWSWTTNDSTEFARRHLSSVASNIYWAQKSDDNEVTFRRLGEAAAHAEFAISIMADADEHANTFGFAAADMVEKERARPWIAHGGPFPAPAMPADRRTQLIEHFASRFAAVTALKTSSAEAASATDGAADGYWEALHLMAPSRSRANLESAAATGETDRSFLSTF